jgi:hypothetical protein
MTEQVLSVCSAPICHLSTENGDAISNQRWVGYSGRADGRIVHQEHLYLLGLAMDA